MLKLSITLLVTAIIFLIFYLASGRSKNKKRKKSSVFHRFSGAFTVICIIGSAVFGVIYCKNENIKLFDRLKTYELPAEYEKILEKDGEDAAYPFLPVGIFTQNDDIYFTNSKNDAFILKTDKDGSHSFTTSSNNTVFIGGDKTLKATVTDSGDLILDGYFLYSKYDEEYLGYSNKTIAKNVKYCSFTDNSLFYITNSGDLYSMGFNEYGQLSDNTTKNKPSPVFVMSGVERADISDTHAMIIDKYGTLFAAGDNSYSQLGNKNAISSTELTKVMQGVRDVAVGNYFSLVLTVNGELYSAGTNEKGQLGNNGGEFRAELVPVMTGVEKISVNGNTCAALTYGGELYVWGDNSNCKAGAEGSEIIAAPKKVQDNIYDFALSKNGVTVLNKDRTVLTSGADGKFTELIIFNSKIPEQYKEKNPVQTPDLPEKV